MSTVTTAIALCEHNDKCAATARYYVHVRAVPQRLNDGSPEGSMEAIPAGRSMHVCGRHLARTVRELDAHPHRIAGAPLRVTVTH